MAHAALETHVATHLSLMTRLITLVELIGRYSKLVNRPLHGQLSYISQKSHRRSPGATAPRVHNAQKRLGPELVAQLVADYQAGDSTPKLMSKYGIGKGAALSILEHHGVPRRNQGLSDADIPRAAELYQAGQSLRAVAGHFGCDAETVRKALHASGIAVRQPWQRG
jgi:hypothetical protein